MKETSDLKKLPPGKRKEILAEQLLETTASGGRVVGQTDYKAVVAWGKPINHILHLILSVLTLGLWLIVWLILGMGGGEKRVTYSVDEYGRIDRQ